MKTIKCDISEVTLIDTNVLFIDIEKEKDFEMKDFDQLKDAAGKRGNGIKFYNIVNVGDLTTPSADAQQASCSEEGSVYKYADAFVINSLAQKILANIYMKINKPVVPTRFFNNLDAAKLWIAELRCEIEYDNLAYEPC